MHKPFLYPLIPRPIPVDTESVRGNLFIDGNLELNYIRFRFCFAIPKETSPLAVSVMAAGKKYFHNCIIRNQVNDEVETVVFHPEFYVGQQFMITGVDPLVEFNVE